MAEAKLPIEHAEKEDWEAKIDQVTRPDGRLVYMGQGQVHYTFYKGGLDSVWPMKKKISSLQTSP
jgi:hypothetical protein